MRSRIKSRLESPPGPFRRSFWRSPIRGPWLTSMFGLVLLASIPVVFATGLLSYAAYNPDLSPVNDETRARGCSASTCSPGPLIQSGSTGSTRAFTSPWD